MLQEIQDYLVKEGFVSIPYPIFNSGMKKEIIEKTGSSYCEDNGCELSRVMNLHQDNKTLCYGISFYIEGAIEGSAPISGQVVHQSVLKSAQLFDLIKVVIKTIDDNIRTRMNNESN